MKKLVTVFTMLLALTGCVKVRYDLVIKDEKTGEGKITLLVQEQEEEFKQSGVDGKNIKAIRETIDGKKYAGIKAEIPDDETKEIVKNIEVKDGKMTFTLTSDQMKENQGNYGDLSAENVKQTGFDMTYMITMPGEIESTEIGKKDGKVVTITIDDMIGFEGEAKIVASAGGGSSNMMLFAGIAALVVVAGIVVVVMKKKKANENADSSVGETEFSNDEFEASKAETTEVNDETNKD